MNRDTIHTSVGSIYNKLLEKRRLQEEALEEEKQLKKEAKLLEEVEKYTNSEEDRVMTKKEKRQKALDNWKEVIIGLTGDDLEYITQKKDKKKYRNWIGEDNEINSLIREKPKRKKPKNFNKEFEPELNMLKNIVADQNKFTVDLQKRYSTAAGPNTKDAMPLNKTLVELAAVINTSRSNSLGVLREIGNLKKTIADLYMKQKKLDSELGGDGFNTQDLGLMGSSLASNLFSQPVYQSPTEFTPTPNTSPNPSSNEFISMPTAPSNKSFIEEFDPSSWNGEGAVDGHTKFEAIPHSIVVEWHKNDNIARFKAIRNDNGEELNGAPVPTCNVKSFDEKELWAKDEFDQVYKLEIL